MAKAQHAPTGLTVAQQRFIDMERRKEEWKQYLEELREATQEVANEIGVGGYFQDADGTVFKIVIPAGRFVEYETIGYVRTRREGESRGTLSEKEAKEQGFVL